MSMALSGKQFPFDAEGKGSRIQCDHASVQCNTNSPFFWPLGVVLTNGATSSFAAFSLTFFSPAGVVVATAFAAFAASLASFSSRLASFLAR